MEWKDLDLLIQEEQQELQLPYADLQPWIIGYVDALGTGLYHGPYISLSSRFWSDPKGANVLTHKANFPKMIEVTEQEWEVLLFLSFKNFLVAGMQDVGSGDESAFARLTDLTLQRKTIKLMAALRHLRQSKHIKRYLVYDKATDFFAVQDKTFVLEDEKNHYGVTLDSSD